MHAFIRILIGSAVCLAAAGSAQAALYAPPPAPEAKPKQSKFDAWDKNGDGVIDRHEFRQAAQAFRERGPEAADRKAERGDRPRRAGRRGDRGPKSGESLKRPGLFAPEPGPSAKEAPHGHRRLRGHGRAAGDFPRLRRIIRQEVRQMLLAIKQHDRGRRACPMCGNPPRADLPDHRAPRRSPLGGGRPHQAI